MQMRSASITRGLLQPNDKIAVAGHLNNDWSELPKKVYLRWTMLAARLVPTLLSFRTLHWFEVIE